MPRPVFLPLFLSLTCLAPLALAAVPTDEGTPSLLSRIGMPEWPSDPADRSRELSLPIWAVLGASMLDFSGTEAKSASTRAQPGRRRVASPAERRVPAAAREVNPRARLAVARRHAALPKPVRIEVRRAFEPQGANWLGALY